MSDFNIDKIFKKQLGSYSESPPDIVWDNINNELNIGAKSNRSIFYKIMLAASIAFMLGVGFAYLIFENQDKNLVVENNQNNIPVNEIVEKELAQNNIFENKISKKVIKEEPKKNTFIENNIVEQKTNTSNNNVIAKKKEVAFESPKEELVLTEDDENYGLETEQDIIEKDESKLVAENSINEDISLENNDKLALYTESLLNDQENEIDLYKKEESSKWRMGGQVTPTYSYRHIVAADQSEVMRDYYNATESGLIAYSGGVNVQYEANSRLSVKSGVYYSKLGQTVENTYQPSYYKSNVAADYQSPTDNNIKLKSSAGILNVSAPVENRDAFNSVAADMAGSSTTISVEDMDYLLQSMSFIELPILLSYKLIDRKMDVNFIGGLGANIMVDQQINYRSDGNKTSVGTTSSMNKFNYNGTLGLGVEYNLVKNVIFSLEPTFRYYLNSINQDESINMYPYSFGFFSGLSYSF